MYGTVVACRANNSSKPCGMMTPSQSKPNVITGSGVFEYGFWKLKYSFYEMQYSFQGGQNIRHKLVFKQTNPGYNVWLSIMNHHWSWFIITNHHEPSWIMSHQESWANVDITSLGTAWTCSLPAAVLPCGAFHQQPCCLFFGTGAGAGSHEVQNDLLQPRQRQRLEILILCELVKY